MDPVVLREGGLVLRPWQAQDADEVFRACQDPWIQRWTTVPSPYTRADAVGFVSSHSPQQWAAGTGAPLGVFDAGTGELLGSNGLVGLDLATGTAEIGYWMAPWARGRGVATAATRAVARWALQALGIQRLTWRALVGNHASRLVAARAGFHFEGVLRRHLRHRDDRLDGWIGALLPGELRESDAPDDPALARVTARCRTFGAPQPTLPATTPSGEPVRLRPLRPEDVPACVRAASDPESVRFTSVPHPYEPHHAQSFIAEIAPTAWVRGTSGIFAIADADDALVGTMDLRLHGDELTTDTGDVGYLVGPWARGHGYASTALRAVCDWGFAELALHRIEWRAYVGNAASRATARRAGFSLEGTNRGGLVHRGSYEDVWLGARLATDEE